MRSGTYCSALVSAQVETLSDPSMLTVIVEHQRAERPSYGWGIGRRGRHLLNEPQTVLVKEVLHV
jgi:hypothetical protein